MASSPMSGPHQACNPPASGPYLFDSPEFIADPIKCCLLSVDEKRELVRELSKYPDNALELLHEWTRRDIVQILCSVFRKGRTFDGASKQEILNSLIKVVNGKSSGCRKRVKESDPEPNSSNLQCPYKKQKKNAVPVVPVTASTPVTDGVSAATNKAHLCQNSACRAGLNPADKFCRRCSCCICLKYDDNKDPSLWLFCDSDQPSLEESCGLSCHLECGFKDERSGILQRGQSKKLDGGYYSIHCGKQNDLLRCWKKQMLIAKDARRLDVLCHRILSHKILISTEKYMVLHEFVDKAMKKLEGEFGPITGLPDMGRRLVGRLAVAVEVQKLCSCAIETLESMFSGALTADLQIQRSSMVPSNFIKLEDISHGSITVVFDLDICPTLPQGLIGFNLWRRKASIEDYPSKPTGIILMPSTSLVVRGLAPFTCYVIKVIAFTNSKEVGSWEVRTKTICFPNKVDAKISMAVDAGTDPNNRSLKADSISDVSNPSSGDVKSDNDCTAYADPNRSLKSHVEYCTNIDILYPEKSSLHCNETTSNSRDLKIGVAGVTKVGELEEAPKVSASGLDDNEEEPGSAAQAALLKRSSELMVHSHGTLKQNQATIGSQFASYAHTVQKPVSQPESSGLLLTIIQKGAENCKGVSGRIFEAKSSQGTLRDKPDNVSLPCKRTPGRIEEGGHNEGPSEPNTSAQVSSLRKSSNLMPHKQGILLENPSCSLVPIAAGSEIIRRSSKSNNDDCVPQRGPLKSGTELRNSSNKNTTGKPVDIDHKDELTSCVKVIRWRECKGYIEANFRLKFLTWFSLGATQHERRLVSVFVDALIDDPVSLAGQLHDTFSDAIYSKRPCVAPSSH